MPDKFTLEAFVNGLSGDTTVSFNLETGTFEWVNKEALEKAILSAWKAYGEDKTEEGLQVYYFLLKEFGKKYGKG